MSIVKSCVAPKCAAETTHVRPSDRYPSDGCTTRKANLHGRLGKRPEWRRLAVGRLRSKIVLGDSGKVFLLGGGCEVLLGCGREVFLLGANLGCGRGSTVLIDRLLSLCRCLLRVALHRLDRVFSVLSSEILDLLGLLVRNVVPLLNLSIDGFLVLDVDKRSEEGKRGSDQRQAPERNKLDEKVRNQ